MSVRQDQVQVNVEINGAKAGSSLKEIQGNVKQLNRELQLLTPGTDAFNKKLLEIAQARRPLDDARDAIKRINQELKDSEASGGFFKNALSGIVGVFTGGALLEGAKALFSGVKGFLVDTVADARDAQRSMDQLTTALRGNVEEANRLAEQADKVEKGLNGLFSAEDVQDAQATLAVYTQDGKAIEALIPKILDLSAAKGVDLKTAADAVGRSLEGNGDSLKKLGVSVKDAANEEQRLGIIVDGLTEKVGGQAEIVAASTRTGWDGLSISLGDIFEKVANAVIPIINQLGSFLNELVKKSQPVIDVFKGIFSVFAEVWTQVKQLLASFGLFNDKVSVADRVIQALTVGARILGDVLRFIGTAVRDAVAVFNELVARGSGAANALITVFSGFKEFFSNVFSNIGDILKGVFTLDVDLIKAGVADLKNVYSDLGTQVSEAFAAGYKTVKDRQKAAADQAETVEEVKQVAKATARGKKISDAELAAQKKAHDEKVKKEAELSKLLDELRTQVEDSRLAAMQEGIQKEIAQENTRYAREQEAFTQRINALRLAGARESQIAEQNAAFRESVEDEHQNKLTAISIKYIDKKKADQLKSDDELKKQRESNFQGELESINTYYDTLIAAIRAKEAEETAASAKNGGSPEEIAQIRQRSADAVLAVEIGKNQQLLDLNREFGKSTLEQETTIADQRIALAERTANQKAKAEAAIKGTIKDSLDFAVEALGRDEAARKKNAGLIKAFSLAKISVNLAEELSGIFSRANQNYLNALIPGSGNIIGGIQAALAVGRAALNVSKVNQAQFAKGGLTGSGIGLPDSTGHKVAGVVHANEWVSPQWMTQHPVYGQVIHHLEDARVKGFADGGFTTTPAAGIPLGGLQLSEGVLLRIADAVERFPNELKARVTYTDFESIEDDVSDVREKASIG